MLDILSIMFIVWAITHCFGFIIMWDLLDEYDETEYEKHAIVLHMVVPIIFVVKYRKNFILRITQGIKLVDETLIKMFKIIKFKKGE